MFSSRILLYSKSNSSAFLIMPKKGNNKRNVKKLSDSDASEGVANKKVAHVSVSDANLVNEPQLGKDTKLVIKLPPLLKRPMQSNKPENVAVKVENVQSNVGNEASEAATNLLGELKNREPTMDIAEEKIVTQEQKPPFDYWKKLEAQAQLKVVAKQGEIDFTMDDFISFDQHAVKKSANLLYGKQSELEIKNNNQVDEYEISPENILAFSGTSHFLSMMFLSDFQINGNVYKSVEHYYQASKLFALCGPTFSARLASVRKPAYVKKFVRRILAERSVPRGAVEKWKKTQGLTILNFAIHQKFGQNPSLAKRLIETEKKILAHAFDGDGYLACNADEKEILKWAEEHNGEILKIPQEVNWENAENVPVVGKGKNLLGAICMKVRQELLTKHGAILGEN